MRNLNRSDQIAVIGIIVSIIIGILTVIFSSPSESHDENKVHQETTGNNNNNFSGVNGDIVIGR